MNNLINVFMDFKVKYFLDCTKLIYRNNHKFIIKCMKGYFYTYIDNYYYYTYNTLSSDTVYSDEAVEKEFKGIMEEMLDDYSDFELTEDNEVYTNNRKAIVELKDICLEIIKLDKLRFDDLDDLKRKTTDFFMNNDVLSKYVEQDLDILIKFTKSYNIIIKKLLKYDDKNFILDKKEYVNNPNKYYVTLNYNDENIKSIQKYRKGLVYNTFNKDDRLNKDKFICLINKVLLQLLKDTINNEINYYFITVDESMFYKDKIINSIYKLMDNLLFKKYVVLCCDYHTYLSHKKVFEEDFQFGCTQKFKRINDIYKKTVNIYNEGVFNYLIVINCREKDKEYFVEYKADGMDVLLIKEED